MAPATALVPFVQFDLPGPGTLPDGRYIVRDGTGAAERVLISEQIGTMPTRGRLRGRKAAREESGEPPSLPVRRVTCALGERLDDAGAASDWLAGASGESADQLVTDSLALVNRAIAGYRVSAGNPAIQEVSAEDALAIRIGYGIGDQVAASGWTDAVKLPPVLREKRRPGTEDVRPPQRLAAILAGRDDPDPWELHALRARADFEAGRSAETIAEIRAALAGFDEAPPDFAANLRSEIAGRLADARAIFGPMEPGSGPVDPDALADAVDLFTRLQNRRRQPPVD